ncbi:uncharacterized protein KY384_004371 [Bacidia gigantensis]|uniref:uncharacterized protein n=1 Tax=Bacidia gigantensis TaxID=2732470 RepID=UPI001D038768|nr:uncharacterized protein KY384_004371 [Bacidia gigantensis]KAG8531014.1 hypothetical protein KY384_004371 [Bacidia gigantensis]
MSFPNNYDTFDKGIKPAHIHPLTFLLSSEPEYADLALRDEATHFWAHGNESVEQARRLYLIFRIAKMIQAYMDAMGLYPLIWLFELQFEDALTPKERNQFQFQSVSIKDFWVPYWRRRRDVWSRDIGYLQVSYGVWELGVEVYMLARNSLQRWPRIAAAPKCHSTVLTSASFNKIPFEIWSLILGHLITPVRALHELSGRVSDFIAPQILGLNRATRIEALRLLDLAPLTIKIEETDFGGLPSDFPGLSNKIPCTRLIVDINVVKLSQLIPLPVRAIQRLQSSDWMQDYIQFIIRDLSQRIGSMPKLKELTLKSHRSVLLPCEAGDTRQGVKLKLFPDEVFRCFRNIKGLEKVEILGDISGQLILELQKSMRSPSCRGTILSSEHGMV